MSYNGDDYYRSPSGGGNGRGRAASAGRCVAKTCGADMEVANFLVGSGDDVDPELVAAWLLAQIPGATCRTLLNQPQETHRRFLRQNGGSAYIDLSHLELCVPEVADAYTHAAACHAMWKIVRAAWQKAGRGLGADERIEVLLNNSDGRGCSWGTHLNVSMSRSGWRDLFRGDPLLLPTLASWQASSIVLTGQGKVGSENSRPPVRYQISQRADFMETLRGTQTTFNRPIVNERDEALSGSGCALARLHVIFYDNVLCHVAAVMRIGLMQIATALIEAEALPAALLLEDPLAALHTWSRDPGLTARCRLAGGGSVTAVEHQQMCLGAAFEAAVRGELATVPRADDLLALWQDTLARLEQRDFAALSRRLDWVLKMRLLERAAERSGDREWTGPQLKYLDHVYSSIDPQTGLFWICKAAGQIDELFTDDDVERLVVGPPEQTRAWTRARLLQCLPRDTVFEHLDWDRIEAHWHSDSSTKLYAVLELGDPAGFARSDCERLFDQHADDPVALVKSLGGWVDEIRPWNRYAIGMPSRLIH